MTPDIRRIAHETGTIYFENKSTEKEVKNMKKIAAMFAIIGMLAGSVAFAEVVTTPTTTAKSAKATKKVQSKKAVATAATKTAATVTAPTGTK